MGGETVCNSIHMRHDHVMRQLLMMLRIWKGGRGEEEKKRKKEERSFTNATWPK